MITDATEKLPDGSHRVKHTPSVEAQHAMALFKSIPHVSMHTCHTFGTPKGGRLGVSIALVKLSTTLDLRPPAR